MPEGHNSDSPSPAPKRGKGYLVPFFVLLLIVVVILLGQYTNTGAGSATLTYGDVWLLIEGKHEKYELREAVLHRPLVQVLGFRQQIDAQAKGLQ